MLHKDNTVPERYGGVTRFAHLVIDTMEQSMRWRGYKRMIVVPAAILVLLAAAIFLLRHRIFITVEPGEVLVVYHRLSGGTTGNTVGREGLNVILPWDTA